MPRMKLEDVLKERLRKTDPEACKILYDIQEQQRKTAAHVAAKRGKAQC